jgi:hypothetical protein
MKNSFKLLALIGLALPEFAGAHAFGQQYTLPLPLWLYIYGGGLVIIISFLLIGYFTTHGNPKIFERSKVLAQVHATRVLQGIGLFFLGLTILAGFAGNPLPTQNFAPVFFWVIFLLGFTYLTAVVGNLWETLNPWKNLAKIFEGRKLFNYPKRLGFTPALLFYAYIIWLELLSNGAGVQPQRISLYLITYASISILASVLFGVEDWFRYGDFFSVFFGLISRISPIVYKQGQIILRWPLSGLLEEGEKNISVVLFIIFMLASTAFDGFRESIKAYRIFSAMTFIDSGQIKQLLLLSVIYLLFFFLFFAAVWLMTKLTKTSVGTWKLALSFAYSLVPIVLAYNLAHYFTLLMVQGQGIIGLISDPLNLGWNLFGTREFVVHVGIIGAKAVWELQVIFILAGHIAGVYVAHILALRNFGSRKNAFISQLPMLMLMVAYTMAGLWILAQPLTLG